MAFRFAPKPDDLLRKAQWRKDKASAWFHKVTSQMSEAEIISECAKRGMPTDSRSLHDLQTALLRLDGDDQ